MFTIHVVNSVKGGCGKSTFCLFLENFLLGKKEEFEKAGEKERKKLIEHKPIIIDLDLSGSSWYKNFEKFLTCNVNDKEKKKEKDKDEDNKAKFLNDLIADYSRYINHNHIFRIKESLNSGADNSKKVGERILEVIMANPDKAGNVKDEEIDLFENSIFRLICDLEHKGKTDIILDMPPGYEAHTERIVKHLLFDLDSPLYREYVVKEEGKKNVIGEKLGIGQTEYSVKFYMLSGIDASMRANAKYMSDFYTKANYSSVVGNLENDDIYFVINDIENATKGILDSQFEFTPLCNNTFQENITKNITNIFELNKANLFLIRNTQFMHMKDRVNVLRGETATSLNIQTSDLEGFNKVFNKAIPTEKADN